MAYNGNQASKVGEEHIGVVRYLGPSGERVTVSFVRYKHPAASWGPLVYARTDTRRSYGMGRIAEEKLPAALRKAERYMRAAGFRQVVAFD